MTNKCKICGRALSHSGEIGPVCLKKNKTKHYRRIPKCISIKIFEKMLQGSIYG